MKRSFYYHFYVLFLILLLLGCSFAQSETGTDHLTIVSWNVQNLFDGIDNGLEYNDFKNNAGWNNEKYQARLQNISAALKGESGIKPDILALIEVENEGVIRDLADSSCLNYSWSFFAGTPVYPADIWQNDDSPQTIPIGIGVLSALPFTEARVHSFHSGNDNIPRPVVEVWVDTGSGPLVLLVCHWKSKREGEKKTESLRRAGAALVVRRLAEIEAEMAGTPVVIMGDLNENYDEFSRIAAAYPCALLPDTNEAAALIRKTPAGARSDFQDFLVLSGDKPPNLNFFTASGGLVYSPWFELEEEMTENQNNVPGSYYYKDTWETIDHFLLNPALFSGSSLQYGYFRVLSKPPFANAAGHPNTYNPRTGNGLSDHLPIALILTKTQ
ncbi:MAG: endonuclease/exonuclease/phosphatase family protein [Treponema sp.]|nr:endonuclease/exonuclease/phosphatase family protein [Treponema sp.]